MVRMRSGAKKSLLAAPFIALKSRPKSTALAILAALACGGVQAETLAQPKSTALEDTAAHYVRYRQDISKIEATPFDNAAATRQAHKLLAAHNPDQLAAGWVAYAALVAAETPEFIESVEKQVNGRRKLKHGRLRGRDAFFAKLSEDPSYPRKMKGAKEATARVLEMTVKDAGRFSALGEQFKSQAYAMQKTKWGKQRISSSKKRLIEAEKFASSRPDSTAPTLASKYGDGVISPTLAAAKDTAWAYDWGNQAGEGSMREPNAQVVMDRVLNLAARYALNGMNEKIIDVYSRNNKSQQCLSMAKLTLKQCIAATRTPYEEAFCLGEHGLNDIGSCVGWVAGAS